MWFMVRGMALGALAGGFLYISPRLRDLAWETVGSGVRILDQYSPLSYAGLVLATIVGFLAFLSSSSGPR